VTPLLAVLAGGIAATVACFAVARRLQLVCRQHPAMNPVLVAALALVTGMFVFGVEAADYAPTAAVFTWLLGPHVALLAIPLYRHRHEIVRSAGSVFPAVVVGGSVAALAALVLARGFAATEPVAVTVATKSVTTAVAIDLAALNGGLPHLASLVVILTGVFGACFLSLPLRLFGWPSPMAQGLALGVSSHAIGTARALYLSERTAAYASVGMILNALVTALTLPWLLALVR
jgi:putative effector of murein hydrolase